MLIEGTSSKSDAMMGIVQWYTQHSFLAQMQVLRTNPFSKFTKTGYGQVDVTARQK